MRLQLLRTQNKIGGETMKYEQPILDILYLDVTNIVVTSLKDGVFTGDDDIPGGEF